MAANDDIPRGWVAALASTGGELTVVIPETPWITHVLTEVSLSGYVGSLATPTSEYVQVFSNSNAVQSLGLLLVQPVAAGSFEAVSFAWTGKLAVPVSTQLSVVLANVPGAGSNWLLEIQGYDT